MKRINTLIIIGSVIALSVFGCSSSDDDDTAATGRIF